MSEFAPSEATEALPKHILVVEDNVILRFILAEWLRAMGYMVLEAASADEAIIVLASAIAVDFVVTDVQMPGTMNGFGLLRHINKTFPSLPVIVVSTDDSYKELKEESIVFFRKPYALKDISAHIAKHLDHPHASE